jgi:photosystem II stability/assembly factor-like uncharacterized protein
LKKTIFFLIISLLLFNSCNKEEPNPLTPLLTKKIIIENISANPSTIKPADQSTLICLATAEDGVDLSYTWSTTTGTFPNNNTGSYVIWKAPSFEGNYRVKCVVSNGIETIDSTLMITVTNNAQYKWKQINFTPSNYKINKVFFKSANIGWAVGSSNDSNNYGIILKTSDGGYNWALQYQEEIFNQTFASVYFISETTGIVTGNSEIILRTTDGGNSWEKQNNGQWSNLLSDVKFISSQNGWIVGYNTNSGVNPSFVFKTTNGGENWTRNTVNYGFRECAFTSEGSGWASNYSTIYKTTDGGSNWQEQIITPYVGAIVGLCFPSADIGYFAYLPENGLKSSVFKTTDRGNSWVKIHEFDFWVRSTHFITNNIGWIVGNNGNIYKTTDGGLSFIRQPTGYPYVFTSVNFVNEKNGWAVDGINGTLFKYID